MINLKERIESARKTPTERVGGRAPVNCHGTTLYLVGQQETDEFVEEEDAKKAFAKMKRVLRYSLGNVVFRDFEVRRDNNIHDVPRIVPSFSFVITNINPLLVTYREWGGNLIENEFFARAGYTYSRNGRIYNPNSSRRGHDFLLNIFNILPRL